MWGPRRGRGGGREREKNSLKCVATACETSGDEFLRYVFLAWNRRANLKKKKQKPPKTKQRKHYEIIEVVEAIENATQIPYEVANISCHSRTVFADHTQ